jgi:hypothetical protein
MARSYLEVTFRKGKPLAGYYYLPRRPGDVSVRSEKYAEGLVVDYASDGRPIGIEFTSPTHTTLADVNRVLTALHAEPASHADLAPLATKLITRVIASPHCCSARCSATTLRNNYGPVLV